MVSANESMVSIDDMLKANKDIGFGVETNAREMEHNKNEYNLGIRVKCL